MRRTIGTTCLAAALVAVGGCGDAPTTDTRQWYTKAPLEDPGLTITAEEPSEMARLGDPNLLGAPVEDAGETEPAGEAGGGDSGGAGGQTDEPEPAGGADGDRGT